MIPDILEMLNKCQLTDSHRKFYFVTAKGRKELWGERNLNKIQWDKMVPGFSHEMMKVSHLKSCFVETLHDNNRRTLLHAADRGKDKAILHIEPHCTYSKMPQVTLQGGVHEQKAGAGILVYCL